ncbi:LytTR family DNA-binding domain-containing protein [Caulobacter sp. Root655]|uniref:LytTR family DNA-binding domain-containing protein n=1 Tax=Caulobacter sp. Root655 TaxID=1736578 RepID=UPI000A5EC36C|nr:LytTR family DNA-binding domain-containing protein [Caulobacter sp. Root655]
MPQPRLRQSTVPLRERLARAVGASRTALLSPPALRGWGISTAAGVFLALTGAFGMDDAPLAVRLAYWVGLCLTGALVGTAISWLFARDGRVEAAPWRYAAILALSITLPFTVVVWLVTSLVFYDDVSLRTLPGFLPPVLLITSAMTGLNFMVQRQPLQTHAAPAGAAPPRFLDRLPPRLRGGDLYAVESEDHYLRLHTSKGQDLILLRLSDAVAELEGVEGAQTHRSWWVAKDAVEHAQRGDGRATLTLKGGVEAPVSRAYARALREAGWY